MSVFGTFHRQYFPWSSLTPIKIIRITMIELEELRIPTRALNALTRANIRTVYQLSGMEQKEIAAIPGVGMVTARLIQQELERFGLWDFTKARRVTDGRIRTTRVVNKIVTTWDNTPEDSGLSRYQMAIGNHCSRTPNWCWYLKATDRPLGSAGTLQGRFLRMMVINEVF